VFSVLLPVTNSKALSATVALAAKAEPLAFRHRVQWQYVTVFSSPRTSYVTEPHKQLPLYMARTSLQVCKEGNVLPGERPVNTETKESNGYGRQLASPRRVSAASLELPPTGLRPVATSDFVRQDSAASKPPATRTSNVMNLAVRLDWQVYGIEIDFA
jgi:hypothetical protein